LLIIIILIIITIITPVWALSLELGDCHNVVYATVLTQIYDAATRRYEVPIETPPVPHVKHPAPDYEVKFTTSPFGIGVYRKSTGAVL